MSPLERGAFDGLADFNTWLLECLDAAVSLGFALSSAEQSAATLPELYPLLRPVLQRLLRFREVGLFALDGDGLGFSLVVADPPQSHHRLVAEKEALVRAGSFGWAIQQNRAVQLPAQAPNDTLIVHALSTRTSVRGVLVGLLDRTFLPDASLKLLSLVLLKCASVLEVGALYQHLRDIDSLARKRDAEEKSSLQAQLLQAQKMDAIGRFAGGVAHDFNNLLTAITANLSLSLLDLEPEHPLRDSLRDAEMAARRATELTSQLLTFSRRQEGALEPLVLNECVESTARMLSRLLTEAVTLQCDLDPNLWSVRGDRGQLDQVLVNLAVNARDAMPSGGTLTISTRNVLVAIETKTGSTIPPGEWVVLAMTDDGEGMTEQVQQHMFEPFFTTKPAGMGTGLGLSVVFGIVARHSGHVRVQSAPGKGTSIAIYLPRELVPLPTKQPAPPSVMPPHTIETVLLAEDNQVARDATVKMLRRLGYEVLVARDGTEGLELGSRCIDTISVLVSDVVMPGLSGPELAAALRRKKPALKTLLVSGYPGDALTHFKLGEDEAFLRKPFNLKSLGRKLRVLLGLEPPTNSSGPP